MINSEYFHSLYLISHSGQCNRNTMEEQIQQAIADVKAGLYSKNEAQNQWASLRDDAMSCTQHLIDSGNFNLRKQYMDLLNELNHYVRQLPEISEQLPKVSEQLRPENPEFVRESLANISHEVENTE